MRVADFKLILDTMPQDAELFVQVFNEDDRRSLERVNDLKKEYFDVSLRGLRDALTTIQLVVIGLE